MGFSRLFRLILLTMVLGFASPPHGGHWQAARNPAPWTPCPDGDFGPGAAMAAPKKEDRGVIDAASGLFLRAAPSRNSKPVTRIPGGETVEILTRQGRAETIEGRRAHWFKVRWRKAVGWVFGGFVAVPGGDTGTKKSPAPAAPDGSEGPAPVPTGKPSPTAGSDTAAGLNAKDPALQEEEAAFLKNCRPRASRQGNTLTLATRGGKKINLVDNFSAEESAQLFYFRGYIPEVGCYLVYRTSIEFANYTLIDEATGARVDLDETPVFSPSFKRFVTASLDLEAGFVPNSMKVYRIEKGKISLEWTLSPEEWGPSDALWHGENALAFTRNFSGGKTAPGQAAFNAKAKRWELKK